MRLLLFLPLLLHSYSLKEAFLSQEKNHYVVYQHKKKCSFYRFNYNSPYLTVEEIHLPSNKQPDSWDQWIREGAPHSTGWILYKIDTINNTVEKGYCNKRHCNLSLDTNKIFLMQLFSEPCNPARSPRYAIKFLEGRMELEIKNERSLPTLFVYKKKTQALRKWVLKSEGTTSEDQYTPAHW